ncbi:hypothetical protein [Hyphomicrobium sp. CS1GBMeth3]|uniref:hypothetical protein n=1 Tax=Hyphomicrobium sp. CS1GBMeth3 TaxID=1892845 RepID=UPI000931262B|nr:hypothetical protein [Hyphomicrobium sp. CS1GBMeth3]
MTFKKITTSAAVITSLLAASLSPLATTAANAHDGWRGKHNHGYSRHYDGPRHYHGPRHRYGYKRHKHGRDVAKGIAIGLGVLAVGSILASGHHR